MTKKIIYQDNGTDKAIIGHIFDEDDYFYEVESLTGDFYQIGKRFIVCIKDV